MSELIVCADSALAATGLAVRIPSASPELEDAHADLWHVRIPLERVPIRLALVAVADWLRAYAIECAPVRFNGRSYTIACHSLGVITLGCDDDLPSDVTLEA